MTATFLQSELTGLIQESKRKHPNVRTAAEKSLTDLRALSVTSESQLAGDLVRRSQFIDPFILACGTRNVKLASIGVVGLQRLTASRAIGRARLDEVLDAFKEVATSSLDIQLKILQTLPSLLQLYASDLHGKLLATTLEVCGALQTSKTALVSSTAAATFQQLVTTVFERAEEIDEGNGADKHLEGDRIAPDRALSDASSVFGDLCALLNEEEASFIQIKAISPSFLLEVIGSILTNHEALILDGAALQKACRTNLAPAISRFLTSNNGFALSVRALRIIYVLVLRYVDVMQDECESLLLILTRLLDPDVSSIWRRVLCMEVFRAICQEPALLPRLFEYFDSQNGEKGLVKQIMAAFVRVASEEPSLIGLGRQSTAPSRQGHSDRGDSILIEDAGVGGVVGNVVPADSSVTGISMEWSVVNTPYMEQLDKTELLDIPTTYIYSLVINCIVAIAEGLSKFVMPLSVPSKAQSQRPPSSGGDGSLGSLEYSVPSKNSRQETSDSHKYQKLINPLSLENHPRLAAVKVCANLISTCWPAFLATCSTFLNSALDSTFYHSLIRAFQKLTQVSGVLELDTPRDALLTCLGKAAIPVSANSMFSPVGREQRATQDATSSSATRDQARPVQSPLSAAPRQSVDLGRPSPSVRNLLCMRALLNLGVALGPTLNEESWFIIVETLQHVEDLLSSALQRAASTGVRAQLADLELEENRASFGTEVMAVRSASKRMFEGTMNYGDEAFRSMVVALIRLSGYTGSDRASLQIFETSSAKHLSSPRPGGRIHQTSRSFSSHLNDPQQHEDELLFALSRIQDLVAVNYYRFATNMSTTCSWDLIVTYLLSIVKHCNPNSEARLKAADIANEIAVETMQLLIQERSIAAGSAQLRSRCLSTMTDLLVTAKSDETTLDSEISNSDLKIHIGVLKALESIVGRCGESIDDEWDDVFEILNRTFTQPCMGSKSSTHQCFAAQPFHARSRELIQTAFETLQLVVSDFLGALTFPSLATLTAVLLKFGLQTEDLNIALTTSNFFGSVASLLQPQITTIDLSEECSDAALLACVYETQGNPAATALWMLLLIRLAQMCRDERPDARTSAMRILFNIIEASSSKMTARTWNLYLRNVVFDVLQGYHAAGLESSSPSHWIGSSLHFIQGSTDILVSNIDTAAATVDFVETWTDLVDIFDQLLSQKSLQIWASVFLAVARIVHAITVSGITLPECATKAFMIWSSHHPYEVGEKNAQLDSMRYDLSGQVNQDAFVRHTSVFIEAFNLTKTLAASQPIREILSPYHVMQSFRNTIFKCTHPQYTTDVKSMAPEQQKIIEALPMLRELLHARRNEFATFILEFVLAPLRQDSKPSLVAGPQPLVPKAFQSPTYVAFSAECVGMLDDLISTQHLEKDILDDLAASASISSLAQLILSKYSAMPLNSDAPLWQKATRTSNNLVAATMKYINHPSTALEPRRIEDFFSATTAAANAILNAPNLGTLASPLPKHQLLDDESFDITSFSKMHSYIIPALGTSGIPEITRKSYILTLFHASLVAQLWFFDLPSDLINEPLKDFSKVRIGTVCPPTFLARQRLCYTALDVLFSLVSNEHKASTDGRLDDRDIEPTRQHQHLTLAKTAAPYFLLRVVHAFKTFLADQRLRSLEPLPKPLRIELLTLLTKCLELRCEDEAFTSLKHAGGGPGSSMLGIRDGKTHLRILYPMVLRVQEMWAWCPRLKGGGAWQEGVEGSQIEAKLKEWGTVVAGGWGLE